MENSASNYDDTNDIKFFDRIREQLRFWPYTLHQVEDTLDIGLIEGRGKQLLFRAINSHNLTAFVGSGLSMSYGRLGWKEWSTEQQRVVKRNSKAFIELAQNSIEFIDLLCGFLEEKLESKVDPNKIEALAEAKENIKLTPVQTYSIVKWLNSRKRAIDYAQRQIEGLSETFRLADEPGGSFPGGEELPVKFEIAQQLHNQLRRHAELFLAPLGQYIEFGIIKLDSWPGAWMKGENSAPFSAMEKFRIGINKSGKLFKSEKGSEKGDYEDSLEHYSELMGRPEAFLSFEKLAKVLLVDERPHAMLLLRQGLLKGIDIDDSNNTVDGKILTRLERELDVFSTTNLKRDLDGIRENSELYRVLQPFRFENLEKLRDDTKLAENHGNVWSGFFATVKERLEDYHDTRKVAGDRRQYLTPSSRFLLPVYLSLFHDPFEALALRSEYCLDCKRTDCKESGHRKSVVENKEFFKAPEKTEFTSRRSIIADRYDPLSKTIGLLGIRKYITTNYDFEIERFFQDRGYRHFPPIVTNVENKAGILPSDNPTEFRTDGIGGVLRDQTFVRDRASELIAFSVGNTEHDASVYHLHGRATHQDNLVVTERDYMNLYLTEDKQRDTVDEGISLAFSGAPLLFLGLGMEESDLLRPLRQFISNRDRTIEHTSVALLPADKNIKARTKLSSALYLRYGIHTIFYGGGEIDIEQGKEPPIKCGIDWLHRIIALASALEEEVELWCDKDCPEDRSKKDILEFLNTEVGPVGKDLADPDSDTENNETYHENTNALNVLLGCLNDKSDDEILADLVTDHNAGKNDNINKKSKSDQIRLRTCIFTPTRPHHALKNSRHRDEDAKMDGKIHLGFHTALLDKILKMTVCLPDFCKRPECGKEKENQKERQQQLGPILIALQGLQGAIRTGALNAALAGISREQQVWWKKWQESPPARVAEFQRLLPKNGKEDATVQGNGSPSGFRPGTVYVRHWVDNVITPLQYANKSDLNLYDPNKEPDLTEPSQDDVERLKLQYQTGIRAFDTWIAAASFTFDEASTARDARLNRRMVTVAAKRGLGKGTFTSAFASPLGMELYRRAFWPAKRRAKEHQKVSFVASIFINLSFSPEIASVYDMLANVLIDATAFQMCSKDGLENEIDMREVLKKKIEGVSRIAALEALFKKFSDATANRVDGKDAEPKSRLLIYISAVELLFDRNKKTKNGEIAALLKLFFGEMLSQCPVDFIFIGDENGLGSPWSDPKRSEDEPPLPHIRVRLERDNLQLRAKEQVTKRLQAGAIQLDEDEDSLSLRLGNSNRVPEKVDTHFVHFARPVSPVSLLVDNFATLAMALYLVNPPQNNGDEQTDAAKKKLRAAKNAFVKAVPKARENSDIRMQNIWTLEGGNASLPNIKDIDDARNMVRKLRDSAATSAIIAHAASVDIEPKDKNDNAKLAHILRARLRKNPSDLEEWRVIRRRLGDNRFALTILMAAAEHLIVHSPNPIKGGHEAVQFIRDTVNVVRNVGQDRRDQLILEIVLNTYRRYHIIGDPDLDSELQMLILRHLGVIGTPISSRILVRLPDFRKYFERLGIELKTSRLGFLLRALTALAYRGLVFRLDPNPQLVELQRRGQPNNGDADKDYRYALHRVVQTYALSKLDSGTYDPVARNDFAPSIYAAMHSAGPRLSNDSYRFLRSLMIGLSQYPDVPHSESGIEPWLFTTKDHNVKVQALRASLSLARSTFSVSVVSRLSEQQPAVEDIQKRGHLETYRVRLRWIVRMAWELGGESSLLEGGEPNSKSAQFSALYRDEIVWLYNELGVISLAQGNLTDALGFLRQAAEFNEPIEGRSKLGPIFNHIDINHAIVQLERGQFTSCRARLNRVLQATEELNQTVYWTALGYLCLLDQITGRTEGLKERFAKVTHFFEKHNESRAAAIFLNHYGRFMAHRDIEHAQRCISQAQNLAETGGQEDIRHQVELTSIKLRLISDVHPAKFQTLNLQKLQEIDDYGRRMGIWSLQCESLNLRAEILLSQGETTTAGKLLTRSMALALRNSMNLRLNSAMTLYSKTLLARGDRKGAEKIARDSLEMAKSIGYNLETPRAQRVLEKLGF